MHSNISLAATAKMTSTFEIKFGTEILILMVSQTESCCPKFSHIIISRAYSEFARKYWI